MIEKCFFNFYVGRCLRHEHNLIPFLDALESAPTFKPTHWGPDERARLPYDRTKLIEAVCDLEAYGAPGFARRKKKPTYEAYVLAETDELNEFELKFGALDDAVAPAIFEWAERLTASLQVVLGEIHVIPDYPEGLDDQNYGSSGGVRICDLQSFGLKDVCARTWFGPLLVKRFGKRFLMKCPAEVQETEWGAMRIDLVPEPWTADLATLRDQKKIVMEYLASSGLFGDHRYPLSFESVCAPKWKPIPFILDP